MRLLLPFGDENLQKNHMQHSIETAICLRCRLPITTDPNDLEELRDDLCAHCKPLYPPSLLKATRDHFEFVLRLRTGEIIEFKCTQIHGDYVTLCSEYNSDNQYFARSRRSVALSVCPGT